MRIVDISFNISVLERALPMLLRGRWSTLSLWVTAIILRSVLGALTCLVRLHAPRPLRQPAIPCIDLVRAIPVLVLLILTYSALPFGGIALPPFQAAALTLVLAAFTAEVVRKVILLQSVRIVIPVLASVVALSDLLKQAADAQARFANPSPLIGADESISPPCGRWCG